MKPLIEVIKTIFFRDFANQVNAEDQLGLYDKQGTHTFFVPIDSAFKARIIAFDYKSVSVVEMSKKDNLFLIVYTTSEPISGPS